MAITKVTRSVIDDSVFQGTLSSEGFPIVNTNTYVGGFKNYLINGNFSVFQRSLSATITTAAQQVPYNETFVADRWATVRAPSNGNATSVIRISEIEDGPNSSLPNCIEHRLLTTETEPFSTNAWFRQRIENYPIRTGNANAQSSTLSFWVKSNVPGTYSVFLRFSGTGAFPEPDERNYRLNVSSYTINSVDTWEYKTVTYIPDTGAAPNDAIPAGWKSTQPQTFESPDGSRRTQVEILFDLGVSSNYNASTIPLIQPQDAGRWLSRNGHYIVGNDRFITKPAGSYIRITGAQLEIGNRATAFEQRPFGAELALCRRYYYTTYYPDFQVGANVLSAWTGTGGRALEALYAGYTNGHEVDGIRTSSVNGVTTSYETYWLWPVEMKERPAVTIYSMDGRPGKSSIWFQCWTPTLSYVVFDSIGRGNTNGYSFVPVQNVTTFINNNPTVVRTTIGGATYIGALSGFDKNNTLQSWTPYTVDGVNLGWPSGYLGMTDKEKLLIQSTPHLLWHVTADCEF
jgi:hypothetical protein